MKTIIRNNADILVVLLHGLGSNANDFFDVAVTMSREIPNASFCVPNAFDEYYPSIYSGGFQWFDVGDRSPAYLASQIKVAYKKLQTLLTELLNKFKIEASQLVLGGFSQGAMMSLYTAPRMTEKCMAVCAFSGTLISAESLKDEIQSRPDTCVIHGTDDEVVPFFNYELVCNCLSKNRIPFKGYKIDGLAHYITDNEMRLAINFIKDAYALKKQ